jgi:hypothetical protein
MLLLSLGCAPIPDADPRLPSDPFIHEAADLAAAPSAARLTGDGLTTDARSALALVPNWLRDDLRLALVQENDDDQDALAAILLDLDDPYLADEIGFAMAHVGPDVLGKRNTHPEVFLENARMIYEVDPLLDYVTLTEHGEPWVDDDWYTTTTYRVEVDGVVTEWELDRDSYYWFVVHPRIEDEHPWFVEPWEECSSASLECASTPEEGLFWRRFLWTDAATTCPDGQTCPVLSDELLGVSTLYGAADGNDAIHGIAAMMLETTETGRWFSFGAYGERSIQPNRIYGLGRGNCGEWADMTSALSRTALIPNVNVTPSSWDHTWNAFWLDRWVPWEPVNWAFDVDYGSGYATWATRGDTSMWYQSADYAGSTSTLAFSVADGAGAPVDGASIALFTPYEDSWWYAGELATDTDGVASFELGADKQYLYMVESELGSYPGDGYITEATAGTPAGETLSIEVVLPEARPAEAAPLEAEPVEADATLAWTLSAEGRVLAHSLRFDEAGHRPALSAPVRTWVMSEADYDAFAAGSSFAYQAAAEADEAGTADLSSSQPWVLVVQNAGSVTTAAVGQLDASYTGSAFAGTTAIDEDFALLPGEHLAVRIDPVD